MSGRLLPADLQFFSTLVAAGSLSAAARELRISTPAVSKRLAQLESRLGVSLLTRTTRRMGLTAEGETCLLHARRILGDLDDLERLMGLSRTTPSGVLRVNATLGFGRSHIGPLVSRFVQRYPKVDVRLQLSADPPPLTEDAFDVCVRFGPPPEARVIARRLADNERLLCASPAYLARHGEPRTPADLTQHNFISIRQGEEAWGVLRMTKRSARKGATESVKTRGNLTTNDGGIAVQWALDGHGVLLRAEWDIRKYLASGRLRQLLPHYRMPDADLYAVYLPQQQTAARVMAFVDFLSDSLGKGAGQATSKEAFSGR